MVLIGTIWLLGVNEFQDLCSHVSVICRVCTSVFLIGLALGAINQTADGDQTRGWWSEHFGPQ
jgi:uncharacterized membrane protein